MTEFKLVINFISLIKGGRIFFLTLATIVTSNCNNDAGGVKISDQGRPVEKTTVQKDSLGIPDSGFVRRKSANCNGNVFIDSATLNIRLPFTLLDTAYIGHGNFQTYRYLFDCKFNKKISVEIWHDFFYYSWDGQYKYTEAPFNKASYYVGGYKKSMEDSNSRFQLINVDSIIDYRQIGFIDYKVKKTGLYVRSIYVLSPKKDKWVKIKCQYDNSDLGLRFRDSLTQITQSICW